MVAATILLTVASPALAQTNYFSSWPHGSDPQTIGKRVAENFAERKLSYQTDPKQHVHYAEACTWYGSLLVAQLTGDTNLQTRLIEKFNPLFTIESKNIPPRPHVDDRVFGIVPLEIYILIKDPKYLEFGKRFADDQWTNTTPDGITSDARYWIDDMYMIPSLETQAARATGDSVYVDRAARTMSAYLDRLQQTNGLFYHAPDSPYFWSRGNGWVAAGMTEVLRSLPENHPQRARIMAGYRQMMAALLKYQGDDGLWRQLIDRPESWPETSSTGMFAFAMVTGVKNGWLDAPIYGPAARKAWLGLVKHLDAQANVDSVCEGTGKGHSVPYYLDRKRNTGDFHGQAPIVWTAAALLR